MKFSCEACAARYYMDDERVRNKTLRIRCKKCGSVMTVGDGATTLVEQGSDVAPQPRDTVEPTPDATWFYAAAGQTYGPYSEQELLRRFETGRIADEVHVWTQGFAAWLPATQVEAFALAIAAAVPVRQPTQSIDISDLNLSPLGARREQPTPLPSTAAQQSADAESKARRNALRDGLRKSRGAESAMGVRASELASEIHRFSGSEVEQTELVDGSIADATASLLAQAQSASLALREDDSSSKLPTDGGPQLRPEPPLQRAARSAEPTPPPVADSSATHPVLPPSGVGAVARVPLLSDPAALPFSQAMTHSAMASAITGAPTASLMLQIQQSKAANRKRMLAGATAFALLLGGGYFLTRGGEPPAKQGQPLVSPKALPPSLRLTPEQLALKEDRTADAVVTAKQQVRSAIREGASSAVTAIMQKRMAEDAKRKRQGVAAAERKTKVVFDEATGTIAERDAKLPDPAGDPKPGVSASSRPRGIGVAIAAPKLGKVGSPASLPASYFNGGLRKVEESIQYCNQRQLSAEGPLRKPRVELRLSIMPSGRVTTVDFNREVASTTFAGCMRGRKERWIFGAFEGDPLQIAKTYIVE